MSRRFLDNCLYSVHQVFKRSVGLSFTSRRDYHFGIVQMVRELHAGGYQVSNIRHLKARHVEYLLKQWQERNLNTGTIKNRLAQLRFISKQIDKPNIVPRLNEDLNVGERSYISRTSKAIHEIDITKFDNLLVRYSIQLQQHFGLRREEAIKFIASQADQGDHITLQASWTKGGIERNVPIETPAQRALLDEIKEIIGRGKSLIPEDRMYVYQRRVYDFTVYKAGYKNLHGLRHAYAQRRYQELTHELSGGKGWASPHQGGQSYQEMTAEERGIDRQARLLLSNELGHSRAEITNVYLGAGHDA